MSLEPNIFLLHYQVLEKIGAGGMGEVYRARDTKLDRDVAIKVLPAELSQDEGRLRRFEREAKLLAQLTHGNIATLHGLEEADGQRFLVMELVHGEPLEDRIGAKPMAIEELAGLGAQIADALKVAHEQGIVHRDIKPSNILVAKDGSVTVLDFGLAKQPQSKDDANSEAATLEGAKRDLTGSGAIVGTVAYMSPEQVRGEEADPRSDIFSFGSVIYEMATGRKAFPGATAGVVFDAILNRPPTAPAELGVVIPSDVARIIEKALEKDPDLRYQSAADLRADLKRLGRDSESSVSMERHPAAAASPPRSPSLLYGALALGAAALTVYLVTSVINRSETSPPPPRSDWIQLTNFTDSVTQPALSPDGRMLTFLRAPGTFITNGEVYVKMLPDGDPVALTDHEAPKMDPRFSADGALVAYTVPGPWDTWVVPVLGGEPRLFLPNASGLSWIDPKKLLYSEIESGNHMGIVVSTESRSDTSRVYFPEEESGMAHRSVLSPDGSWVAVAEMDEVGWMPCRVVAADGSSPDVMVGPPAAQCRSAAWTPDSQWIYLTVNAGNGFHIWRQRFPDGEPEAVTSGPTEELGIAMASDGRSFVTSVGTVQSTLWIRASGEARQLTSEGYALSPQFATDGRLYYLDRSNASRAFNAGALRVIDPETDERDRLFPDYVISSFDISRDGERIVFVAMDSRDRPELWVAPLDRRNAPRRLPSAFPSSVGYGVDGELFVMETEGSDHFLYRMDEEGGGRRRVVPEAITRYQTTADNVDVSPDGRYVMVEISLEGSREVDVAVTAFPVDGGEPVTICINCFVEWGPSGDDLFVEGLGSSEDFAFPIATGASLPVLPADGLQSQAEALAVEGAEVLDRPFDFAPGLDRSTFAFVTRAAHRNLFRIPITP